MQGFLGCLTRGDLCSGFRTPSRVHKNCPFSSMVLSPSLPCPSCQTSRWQVCYNQVPPGMMQRLPSGDVFIDRSGEHFSYVLEYLRACACNDITFPMPNDARCGRGRWGGVWAGAAGKCSGTVTASGWCVEQQLGVLQCCRCGCAGECLPHTRQRRQRPSPVEEQQARWLLAAHTPVLTCCCRRHCCCCRDLQALAREAFFYQLSDLVGHIQDTVIMPHPSTRTFYDMAYLETGFQVIVGGRGRLVARSAAGIAAAGVGSGETPPTSPSDVQAGPRVVCLSEFVVRVSVMSGHASACTG